MKPLFNAPQILDLEGHAISTRDDDPKNAGNNDCWGGSGDSNGCQVGSGKAGNGCMSGSKDA